MDPRNGTVVERFYVPAPKGGNLGVLFDEVDKGVFVISTILKTSRLKNVLRVGDQITYIGQRWMFKDVEDLKRHLKVYSKSGEKISIVRDPLMLKRLMSSAKENASRRTDKKRIRRQPCTRTYADVSAAKRTQHAPPQRTPPSGAASVLQPPPARPYSQALGGLNPPHHGPYSHATKSLVSIVPTGPVKQPKSEPPPSSTSMHRVSGPYSQITKKPPFPPFSQSPPPAAAPRIPSALETLAVLATKSPERPIKAEASPRASLSPLQSKFAESPNKGEIRKKASMKLNGPSTTEGCAVYQTSAAPTIHSAGKDACKDVVHSTLATTKTTRIQEAPAVSQSVLPVQAAPGPSLAPLPSRHTPRPTSHVPPLPPAPVSRPIQSIRRQLPATIPPPPISTHIHRPYGSAVSGPMVPQLLAPVPQAGSTSASKSKGKKTKEKTRVKAKFSGKYATIEAPDNKLQSRCVVNEMLLRAHRLGPAIIELEKFRQASVTIAQERLRTVIQSMEDEAYEILVVIPDKFFTEFERGLRSFIAVRQRKKKNDDALESFIEKQSRQRQSGKMSDDEISLLDDVDFTWDEKGQKI